jgi:threonine/homoserine/homoserine lactone efflux protein
MAASSWSRCASDRPFDRRGGLFLLPVLLQSLVLASGGLLSVGSITIVLLLLLSDQGGRKGLAYMLGYVGSYMLIGVSVTLVGYRFAENSSGERGGFLPLLFIILGMLLLWLALRNWRKPPSENDESPRLFKILDNITPLRAFAFGALVTILNFKNLAIYLSAVSISLLSDLPLPARIIIVLLDALIFCTLIIVPVLIYIFFPKQADKVLSRLKQALETHSRPIGIWAPLFFGLIFLIRGITGLILNEVF